MTAMETPPVLPAAAAPAALVAAEVIVRSIAPALTAVEDTMFRLAELRGDLPDAPLIGILLRDIAVKLDDARRLIEQHAGPVQPPLNSYG